MIAATATGPSQSPFRAVSGWVPLVLAAAATALLIGYLATGPHEPNIVVENGVARQDESVSAQLWQFLMLLQLPAIAVFASRWLPRDTKRTLAMLAIHAAAFAAAAFPLVLLEG